MSDLERLKYYLKIKNISAAELKRRANLDPTKITNYFSGRTKSPRIDFAQEILRALPSLSSRYWLNNEGLPEGDNQVPEDSVIIKKKELESKNQQILELQQKIINFTDDNELVKRIKELEAWKKETESQIPILYGNIEKLTEIIGKIQETYDEMSE